MVQKINLVFLTDTLNIDGPASREDVLEYLRINNSTSTYDYFIKEIKILQKIPDERYVIFYDTFSALESFKKILKSNDKVKSDLIDSRCYCIFFHTDMIGMSYDKDSQFLLDFKRLCNENNISEENFGFVFHETVLDKELDLMNHIKSDVIFFNRNAQYSWFPDNFAKTSDVDILTLTKLFNNTKGYYRQFKYCSHNNNYKTHRCELLLFLIKENLLECGVTTWFGGVEPRDQGIESVDFAKFNGLDGITDYSKEFGMDVVKRANNLIPNSYDYKIHGLQDYLNVIPYFNSYFNIITESCWGPGYDNTHPQKIHITEKVWKSIVTYQPFIVISSQSNLKKLKEWGFKTFEPWIDESYDDKKTYDERLSIIRSEIIRLCNMSRKELDKWYWEMSDIFEHNAKHFLKFIDNDFIKIKNLIIKGNSNGL